MFHHVLSNRIILVSLWCVQNRRKVFLKGCVFPGSVSYTCTLLMRLYICDIDVTINFARLLLSNFPCIIPLKEIFYLTEV